ncbi:MAG: tetratricopeptide repeat protein [Planctomycetes bacterium]|nr:tetratricopeptide repeat protein [Planctomycetota bacterium]
MRIALGTGLCIAGLASVFAGSSNGSASAWNDEKAAQQLLMQAEQALQQRKPREAAELATKAIEQKADYLEAYVVRARARRQLGQMAEAIEDLTRAIELRPTGALYLTRGDFHSALDRHAEAIADFDRAIEMEPKSMTGYRYRGRERFKAGEVEKSIADFDRAIAVEPEHENEFWERGLSRYYVGQFAQAQKSFEDYHKVGPDDIENGLWRMLSQAEVEGLSAAQKALFKYEPKQRPPFPLLYDLYAGKSKPEDVLEHATDGAIGEAGLRTRLFYAHLYLGMWFVANHDRETAIAHLEKAVALRSTDYMWYVARHQLRLLKREDRSKRGNDE